MNLIDKIANRFGFQRAAKRTYAAAMVNRLTEDWATTLSSADTEVNASVQRLRARARQLERDNPFAERYFKLLCNNVLGASGVGLQMKVRDPDRYEGGRLVKGGYDVLANATIEKAWAEWGERGNCTMDGRLSWRELEAIVLRSAARDGSCFLLTHRGVDSNRFGYSLQLLEADYLREDYNVQMPNGNIVRMGVEMTPQFRPVAYHFFSRHPYDFSIVSTETRAVRIEADRVFHIYRPTRQGQTNGVPWLAPSMMAMRQLDAYTEAELTAARVAACKMGSIEKTVPEGYQGPTDSQGNPTMEMQPGQIMDLPMGHKYVDHDPQHPVSAFGDFVKANLRGISAGLGVSYNSLANDLEGVNYSSIRAGLLEERGEWMCLQNWIVETLHDRVFKEWLEISLMIGALKMPNGSALPASKLDKFSAREWKPRRWAWVDPKKDLEAKILAIENGLDSRRNAIAEQGGDIEDTFADMAADDALAATYGLEFGGSEIEPETETEGGEDESATSKGSGKKPESISAPKV